MLPEPGIPEPKEHVSNGYHRRRSIFPGLLLIVLGTIFLLRRVDPALEIGHIVRVYWPLLFILWGVSKLIDHVIAQRSGQDRAPLLSAGEAALLAVLAFVLIMFVSRDWVHDRFPGLDIELAPFQKSFTQSHELAPQTIPEGAHVTIETARGNITVRGTSGHELRAAVNESAPGDDESAANERMNHVQVVIEQSGNGYVVRPVRQDEFHFGVGAGVAVGVDLDVQVPKTSSVTLHTARGDIHASDIGGGLDARTDAGDLEIHDAGADVVAQMATGRTEITGIAGNLVLKGRGNDVDVSDVKGDATVDGLFFGTTAVRKAAKTTRIVSPWANLTIEQLSGRLEIDSSDIELSDVGGAAKIQTHNKDVTVENVAGQLDIVSSHGDVKVSYATPPTAALNVTNDSGGVDVTLPAKSSFQIAAYSRSGEVDSDFEDPALRSAGESENGQLNGQYGGKSGMPGPKITITTSYGTIQLNKSS
jgi:DUF4097 and DUF4098 domain-containing protein YvlB